MITIYSPDGVPIMVVQERDESRYTHSLMGEHSVRLRFDWTEGVPLPYHSYIEYTDRRWHLFASYIPTQRDGVAEYDVAFYAPEAELANFTAFYLSQGAMEAEWHLTGTLEQFAREIEANLRRINSSLTVDPKRYATEREARYISVEKMTISDLVAKVAEDFSLDWWIEGSELRFGQMPRKEEITARLGELAGAFTPSGEGNPLISRLYAFGSTRNLTNKYRQSQEAISRIAEVRLHLPEAKPYVQGVTNGIEQVEYFEDVYPRYVGRVSAVSTRQSGADTIYKISDTALHIKPKYLLEGQTLRLQFESGALRGMEFDLAITSDGYELVPNDTYGQRLPSANLVPSVGDEYVPFGFDISMVGDEYVPRAEQELLSKASEWLQANNEDRRDVEVTCNPVWVYERGVMLSVGQAIRLVDAIPTGDKVGRITRLEYPLYCPQALTLTVGNTRPMNRIETLRAEAQHKADEAKAFAEKKQREAQQYTERRFVQAEETMQGLLATLGDRYGGEINPVAVKTMQLLAGDERLQFVFVESLGDRTPKALGIDYLSNSRTLRIDQPATLIHYTLPNGRTLSTGDTSRLRVWTLPAYQSPTLSESDKPYYLYALVTKAEGNNDGRFLVSDVRVEDTANEYALLVGMASSEDSDGGRSFVSLHGFSEILPGRITTDRIVSTNGISYFDLLTGRINGQITITNDKGQTIMGTHNDKGQTIVDGGLILSQIIGAVDRDGVLRSYISGDSSKPAFVAGLNDEGTESNVRIEHNGDAKFGQAMIDGRTGQYTFANKGGAEYMRIGGTLTPLNDLMTSSGFSAVHDILFDRNELGSYYRTESIPLQIPHEGSSLIINIAMSFSAYDMNDSEAYDSNGFSLGGYHNTTTEISKEPGTVWLRFRVIDARTDKEAMLWEAELSSPRKNIQGGRHYSKHLAGLPAGRYRLECEANGAGRWTARIKGKATVQWVGDVKEIALGEDGLSLFYGQDRLLYAQRTGDPFLTLRGKVELNGYPLGTVGVLACGVARKSGNSYILDYSGGLKPVSSIVISGRRLTLVHNIGHTNYCITASNHRNADLLQVVARDANSLTIQFTYPQARGQQTLPDYFDFQIVGDIKP